MSEIEAIDPKVTTLTLSGGAVVELEELRLRQFLRLLRIVTEGTPVPSLVGGLESLTNDNGEFGANFLLLVMLGVPNAEDAVVNFLLSMVRPAGLAGGPGGKPASKMTKQEIERDHAKIDAIEAELRNPTLEDAISIIEATFVKSAEDFKVLGKRLASMLEVARKAGMVSEPASSDQYPEA